MSLRSRSCLVGLAFALAASPARADTSATLPTAINLPKGPASIEGFGQGYDISPASGLPSLSYPIEVPPGRAGLEPQLALQYHAGEGAGVLGLGWSLGLPAIERSTRTGIPRYAGTDTWTLRGLGGGEELIEVEPGLYRERIEQGPPILVRDLGGAGLSAVAVDGTGYLFGLTEDARLARAGDIFRLELSAITDVHGNRLDFQYTRPTGTDAPLLAAIIYNDGHASVRFEYEPRPDPVRTHAPGFPVVLGHRLAQIVTEADGEPVRTTTLTYARSVLVPASTLVRIDTAATDGSKLPTWHLAYSGGPGEPQVTTLASAPALDPTADERAWVDIDGDALPDLLDATPGAWRYRKGLGSDLAGTWTSIASPAASVNKSARFADLTGDGIEDLLAQPGEGELWAFTGGSVPFDKAAPIALDLSFDLTDPRVALVDLNLDGRVDVLRHDDTDAWIWLRHFDVPGYLPAEPVPPPPAGLRLGDPGVQLADVDGDRLPDLVRLLPSESRVLVALGEGLGAFAEPVDLRGVPPMLETDRWELADLNGDGAAELARIGHTDVAIWLAQHDLDFAELGTFSWPELQADEVVLLSDVDASGTVDILRVDTDGSQPWRAWSFAERPGLLTGVRTGLGYVRDFSYRPAAALAISDADAADPWTTTPPSAMPVLVMSEETDEHTAWSNLTHHHVRDGWYDPARGEFRGFAELRDEHPGDEATEAASVARRYDLGLDEEARKLQLLASETTSPRGVLVREEHTLEIDAVAPGVRAVRRVATDTFHLEAGPESAAARVRTEWDFDAWGNVLEERALGRVDHDTGLDIPGDERITTTTYAESQNSGAPRDRPSEQVIADANGTQITATRTYYDGPPEQGLPLGQLGTRGAISRIETWIEGDTWIPTLRQIVDAHGNVTRLRDAEDGTMIRRYDDLGRFPIEEQVLLEDGTALVMTATWDARTGNPTKITAPSGAASLFQFDGLGRLTAEIEPGDSEALATRSYRYYTDGSTDPPAVVTELRRVSGAADVEPITQHLDGLGRPILRVTADDAGSAAILAEAIVYASTGAVADRIEPVPLPVSALSPGTRVEIQPTWPRARSTYDALGRLAAARDADGFELQMTYGPLWSDRRDHEDLHPAPPYADSPERTIVDGLGRTTAIEHHLTDRILRHTYTHDPAGRITAHVDPAGHTTRYEHDGGGRLRLIDSPDASRITQRFDGTGRLTERVNATGARIRRAYDRAGRLVHELALMPDGTTARESTRTYDTSSAPAATWERGHLTAVDDQAGHLELVHDARGRVARVSRRFAAHSGEVSLSASTEYDAQGRPVREIYPDGSALERDYTARGLEAPLPGWLADAALDAGGRWTSLALVGDVALARELDHTGRQLRERVSRGTSSLRDLVHQHDAAGLLAETTDLVGSTPQALALAARYQYDDLRRLVRAERAGITEHFTYADDDNLETFAGAPFAYASAHPHAVSDAHGQRLSYDDAGRLARVERPGPLTPGTWQWDPHDRLRSFVADDGRRTEHIYDHTGQEAIRREYTASGELAHETLYFTPAVEVRDGRLVRWIFWAGERLAEAPVPLPRGGYGLAALLAVAVVLAASVRRARPRLAHLITALALCLTAQSCHRDAAGTALLPDAGTRYHVDDRLGSAALILDHRGEIIARDAHTAYGAPSTAWRADDAAGPTYRFTGKEDLPLASAVTIGARHYLPALGRWASPDPQYLLDPAADPGRPGERNLYRYAANNPVGLVDPTGHGWRAVWKVAKGVAKGLYRGFDKVDEFSGIADDVLTIASAEAGIGARVLSALSLASEVLPVSAGDIKDTYRWFRGGERAMDTAGSAVRAGTYRELHDAGAKDSHHIIQNAAARDLPGYNRDAAPAVQLRGPSTERGSPHYRATQTQREAGGGTYAAERRIGYKALRRAGVSEATARQLIEGADRYFQSIGVTPTTPTRIPGTRK